jgi:hypothetical protein
VRSAIPYREFLKNDAGSNDLAVDGSATEQTFYVEAIKERDIYIKTLSFVIADSSQSLNEFANTNGVLANGCLLQWKSSDVKTVDIHDALKTNWDFVRLCLGQPAFGATTDAFRASNVSSTSEGYIPFLDMAATFGLPYGLRLRRQTKDRIQMTIRDDCSAADQFDIIAYGLEI